MSQQSSAVSGGKPQAMSADHPYPVREVSALVASWINRLGEAWVEGEITQLKLRRQSYYSYFSLRDLAETVSLQVTYLSLIHISEPTRRHHVSRMPSSA